MSTPTAPTPLRRAEHPAGALRLGAIRLAVRDIDGTSGFWRTAIGLDDLGRTGDIQRLGVDGTVTLELEHDPAALSPAPRGSGLFHVALLVPARHDLAHSLLRLSAAGARIYGASDHLVSLALYLDDPEGNGIELCWDRPRDQWRWSQDGLAMATLPVSLDELVGEVHGTSAPAFMPRGTRIGHVHLRVSDVGEAERWYGEVIGLDTTVRLPGAAFVSVDGYHHHLGLNSWHSRSGPPNAPGNAGLRHYTIELPATDRDALLERLGDDGQILDQIDGEPSATDPFGNRIRLVTADPEPDGL